MGESYSGNWDDGKPLIVLMASPVPAAVVGETTMRTAGGSGGGWREWRRMEEGRRLANDDNHDEADHSATQVSDLP